MASLLRLVAIIVLCFAAVARGATSSTAPVAPPASADRLSGGLFFARDAAAAPGRSATRAALRAGLGDVSKGKPPAILDARVGQNVLVGYDPAPLPESQLGQAEPHIYRSAADPELLLATFQEGRFIDAGSLDCGYGVSHDGGLTWTRALIPALTQASGGPYNRATDPVAAIGPQGDLYLNTLGSVTGAFDTAAVVVSRSTDVGSNWSAPAVVYQSNNALVMPDKNWMAVNDYAGSATSGRLAVTWTLFTNNAAGQSMSSNLMIATSDDRGQSWSVPVAITPTGSFNQGTQPVYLPDGSLLVVYVTFTSTTTNTQFAIQCKRSANGGRSFSAPASTIVGSVAGWDDPDLRDGVFLPSATVARQSGAVFVTYTAVVAGSPRVLVTKSTDGGTTWSPPLPVSDNPAGVSVVNPAIAATPDGTAVSVVFMDKRNAPDGHNFIDIYAAQSFDGGASWQPNTRVTDQTSDIRYGPPTTRGYMFGDYLGIAPALTADEPCVAIWCDARTGDSDPFTARLTPAPSPTFAAWEIARFTRAELANPAATGALSDPDGDGLCNAAEFFHQSDPRLPEGGSVFAIESVTAAGSPLGAAGSVTISYPYRLADNTAVRWEHSYDGVNWTVAPHTTAPNDFPRPVNNVGTVVFPHTAGTPELFRETFGTDATFQTTAPAEVLPVDTDARLINVSTRGDVGTGANQMIVGFVTDGPKTMLVRAAGPTLASFGVADAIQTPVLTLSSPNNAITAAITNNAWQPGTTTTALFERLGAFPFASGSHDAAVVQLLPAGSYSAVVSGGTGAALVEAYDADAVPGAPSNARIVNLSSRANVASTGSQTLIAGFFISGTLPRRVLIRAVGPALANFGILQPLPDAGLTVYRMVNGVSSAVVTNDDWQTGRSATATAATAQRLGAFALTNASLDSACVLTLAPGAYSVAVRGVNGTTGIALVEVYDAN